MNQKLQIMMLLAVIIYFLMLVQMLKKKKLNLKYSLLWIFSGLLMLLIDIFPNVLTAFSDAIGIIEPTNALFAIYIFCVIIILMSLTAIVSKMNEQIKRLTQTIALLERRIRELEVSKEKNIVL